MLTFHDPEKVIFSVTRPGEVSRSYPVADVIVLTAPAPVLVAEAIDPDKLHSGQTSYASKRRGVGFTVGDYYKEMYRCIE